MKALTIKDFKTAPEFSDNVPEPTTDKTFDTLIDVLAAPIENFDKANAAGRHYSSTYWHPTFPSIPGASGIGRRVDNGQLVAFPARTLKPQFGSYAQRTVANSKLLLEISDTTDIYSSVAAASSLLTSVAPLKFSLDVKPGDTVLVNGATGFAGQLTIQVARSMGVSEIIGTGRNPERLASLKALGATQTISLAEDDQTIMKNLTSMHIQGNLIILDYLWGHPIELILHAIIPNSLAMKRATSLVSIGAIAGQEISLPSKALRTSGLQIIGMQTPKVMANPQAVYKAVWDLINTRKIQSAVKTISLEEAATQIDWQKPVPSGVRTVIKM
ncbi:quinone oxidoreductase family protein [Pediococcus ethanolidurans]|uniref:NADPH:quinone reductase n=1 Tax=Pediococcus ethanolidurans TaxID=319653 RepID=A0A0R2K588_9LACO|nr:zinc-binding alcohol dehydrogenase family protein [Pediococcus ethanolidurans]KRN81575.1 nadph quinone reductase or zn-dependent oxidoreductase [Pediococcus ethanolidurans]GEN95444.1 alcohol dehydrogenase [Pediococcus ethanolidurans]SER68654.1 NADPH:quinone reductase [Pediococcus ethanolidurans]